MAALDNGLDGEVGSYEVWPPRPTPLFVHHDDDAMLELATFLLVTMTHLSQARLLGALAVCSVMCCHHVHSNEQTLPTSQADHIHVLYCTYAAAVPHYNMVASDMS